MKTLDINIRYSELANDNCCLSCGDAAEKSNAQIGEVCIDLGSGRGTDVLKIAEQVGENGFVYGIDVTDEMINKAKSTAKKLEVINVDFIKSDLENIPLKDQTADIIISNCTLNHVNDKFKVWSEIHRLLKKGGRFVISDIYSTEPVPEIYANDPKAVAECWAGAITKEEYLDIINKNDLERIEILDESKPYDKGKIKVVSFTIKGFRKKCNCK